MLLSMGPEPWFEVFKTHPMAFLTLLMINRILRHFWDPIKNHFLLVLEELIACETDHRYAETYPFFVWMHDKYYEHGFNVKHYIQFSLVFVPLDIYSELNNNYFFLTDDENLATIILYDVYGLKSQHWDLTQSLIDRTELIVRFYRLMNKLNLPHDFEWNTYYRSDLYQFICAVMKDIIVSLDWPLLAIPEYAIFCRDEDAYEDYKTVMHFLNKPPDDRPLDLSLYRELFLDRYDTNEKQKRLLLDEMSSAFYFHNTTPVYGQRKPRHT